MRIIKSLEEVSSSNFCNLFLENKIGELLGPMFTGSIPRSNSMTW